jgi:hypothetical protein
VVIRVLKHAVKACMTAFGTFSEERTKSVTRVSVKERPFLAIGRIVTRAMAFSFVQQNDGIS